MFYNIRFDDRRSAAGLSSAALGGAAVGAYQTAFLIYEGFLAAIGTGLAAGTRSAGDILLERAFNTHFPSVD